MSGWFDCGPLTESSPDIQPGEFKVMLPPSHGNSYLGLVVREKKTWESVGQRLSSPLIKGKEYEFSLDLAHSITLKSGLSVDANDLKPFSEPAKLIIWAGNSAGEKGEVLAETAPIKHTTWKTRKFKFKPKKSYSYIILEAYYNTPVTTFYNGNILIDNASPIKLVEPPVVPPATEPSMANNTEKKGGPIAEPPVVKPLESPPPLSEIINQKLKTGVTFRLDKVLFDANKYELRSESIQQLDDLLLVLNKNPDLVVLVEGHTNNLLSKSLAQQLSTNRAKSVVEWLIGKGISASRLQYIGQGWKYPVASNKTLEGRKQNQRVEVRIL